LHITGRRADGYHLLQSVFMLINWCDTLHMDLRADGLISREDLGAPLPADDLVLRAARALQAASGCGFGAHIGIEKSIPAQAGMGGGSSDAATTLLALNRLWQLDWPLARLLPIGLALGADVPFFLGGHNAWVEGIGDIMTPITLPSANFLVVKPTAGLPTHAIFSDPALKRDSDAAILSGFSANPFGFGRNDLQSVAQRLCPGVTQALDWLASLGLSGRMTGSGSAVFAHLDQALQASSAPTTVQTRVCSNLEVHPLSGWAPAEKLTVGGE
jgi:4-diphosphocytidyl-2-C-methyl-D-erythritol kinase